MAEKKLSKTTLVKNWLLTYSSETCYNYERLQGLGNTNAFVPVMRELYPGDEAKQVEELKNFLMTYSFFRTFENRIAA